MNKPVSPTTAGLIFFLASLILSSAQAGEDVDWEWIIDSSQFQQSKLTLVKGNIEIASYYLECDLSRTDLDEEDVARVNKVITSNWPQGIVIAICNVGAHSKLLAILDPIVNREEEVFSVVGAYTADWSLDADKLVIEYDRRCDESDPHCDGSGFKTITRTWPPL